MGIHTRVCTVVPGTVSYEGYDSIRITRGRESLCAYFSAILDPIPTELPINSGQDTRVSSTNGRRFAIVASNYTPFRTSLTHSSNNARFSLDSTVVESTHGYNTFIYHLEELVASMENFRFTAMVTTATLNRTADVRTIVEMTSNNLLNAGWDLQRLYMVWSEITADAQSADVVGILKPWSRLSKARVAKVCQNLKHALAVHRTWTENMDCTRSLAINLNIMSDRWWLAFDQKHGELAMLDPHDIANQVAVVMEMHLGIKEQVPASTALTRRRSLTRSSSTRSSSAMRLKNSFLPPVAETIEIESLEKTRHSIATSHLTRTQTIQPRVPRGSLPATSRVPRLAQNPSSPAIAQHASDIKHVVQEIPNFSRPTKPITMARQSIPQTTQPMLEFPLPPQTQPQANATEDSHSNPVPTRIQLEQKSEERPMKPLVKTSAHPGKEPRPILLRAFPCVPSKAERSMGRMSTESHRPILDARLSDSLSRHSVTLPHNRARRTVKHQSNHSR